VRVDDAIVEWSEPTRPTITVARKADRIHESRHQGTTHIGFSTTGKYVCVAGWFMHLHTPDLKKELRQLRDPHQRRQARSSVNSFAFNADDSRLVLWLGQRAVVWSPDDLEANPVLIAGHGKKVMGVGFLGSCHHGLEADAGRTPCGACRRGVGADRFGGCP